MTATIQADLVITTAPETRMGRRAGDPPGSQSEFAYATAKGDDGSRWELFGLTATARAAIARVGQGDFVTAQGGLAARVEGGVAVIAVNVVECSMRLPIPPRPKAPKAAKPGRCGGTRLASRDGVAAAQSAWLARNGGTQA